MLKQDFQRFSALLASSIPKGAEQQKPFKKMLGNVIVSLTQDSNEHEELVKKAQEVTGTRPGKQRVSEQYGEELIHNYASKGTGSQRMALALYYLLLILPDTQYRVYSQCVKRLDEFLFGQGVSFQDKFDWSPQKQLSQDDEYLSISWPLLLEKYAGFEGIEIEVEEPVGSDFSIAGFKSNEPIYKTEIKLDQGFRFHLTAPLTGLGIALQVYEQKTYPLRFTRSLMMYRTNGNTVIFPPDDGDNDSKYLHEPEDDKQHQFIFMMVSVLSETILIEFAKSLKLGTEISINELNQLAEKLVSSTGKLYIRRVNVKFYR